MKSSEHLVPLHDDIAIPASRKMAQVAHTINKWNPAYIPVLVDEAAQGRSSTCKAGPIATVQKSSIESIDRGKVPLYCFFRAGRLQEDPGNKSTSVQCSHGLESNVDEVIGPRFSCQQHGQDSRLSYHLQMSKHKRQRVRGLRLMPM